MNAVVFKEKWKPTRGIKRERVFYCSASGEKGVVLIVLSLLLLVFAAFFALVIDSQRLFASQSKKRSTAELAALAAMERYRATFSTEGLTPLENHKVKLRAAIERAEEVAGFQLNALVGQPGRRQVNASADEVRDNSGLTPSHTSDIGGTITPGRYFFAEPGIGCATYDDRANECPCGGGVFRGPCFRPNRLIAGTVEDDATAFRVDLHTVESITNIFGSVIGNKSIPLKARGTAALVPRHGVFSIDLSRSICAETHLDFFRLPAAERFKASECSFRLDEIAGSSCGATTANPCLNPGSCQFKANAITSEIFYNRMEQTRPAGLQPRWKHYRDDYQCFTVDEDGNGTREASYLVDTHQHQYDNNGDGGQDGFYRGPEPLSTILSTLNSALGIIRLRAVAGDQIAILGFDQQVLPQRILGPTRPGESLYADLVDISTLNNPTIAQVEKRMKAFFFPRFPLANTNVPEMLLTASFDVIDSMQTKSDGDAFVAMFSDGLSNCTNTEPFQYYPLWTWEDDSGKTAWSWNGGVTCINPPDPPGDPYRAYWYHVDSVSVGDMIIGGSTDPEWNNRGPFYDSYVRKNIAFHLLLFGADVQPSIKFAKSRSNPDVCMDQADALRFGRNQSYVVENGWWGWQGYGTLGQPDWEPGNRDCYGSSGATYCPFLIDHWDYWFGYTMPTGGQFVPIMPACDTSTLPAAWDIDNAACKAGALQERVDNVCKEYDPASYYDYFVIPAWYTEDLKASGVMTDLITSDPDFLWSDYVYNPRIICDTHCRQPEEQIGDFIRKLYAENPYVLVPDPT